MLEGEQAGERPLHQRRRGGDAGDPRPASQLARHLGPLRVARRDGRVAEPLALHEVVLAERVDEQRAVEERGGAAVAARLDEVAVRLVGDQGHGAATGLGLAQRLAERAERLIVVASPRRVPRLAEHDRAGARADRLRDRFDVEVEAAGPQGDETGLEAERPHVERVIEPARDRDHDLDRRAHR